MKLLPLLFASAALAAGASAAESPKREPLARPAYELRLAGGRFMPQTLFVPAETPLVVRISNSSAETIEFESFSLNRERVVEPGKTVMLHLPALKPGAYDFFDDFHSDVAEGKIIARRSPQTGTPR